MIDLTNETATDGEGPRSLPDKRDLLLRLLDHCESVQSVNSQFADFLAKSINQEWNIRETFKDRSPEALVEKLTGWGVVAADFERRFDDLNDRIHDRIETIRPYLVEEPTPPEFDLRLIQSAVSECEAAIQILKLRDLMVRLCGLSIQYAFDLNTHVEELKSRINTVLQGDSNELQGHTNDEQQNEDAPDGPTELGTFRWHGKEVSLSPKPFGLVNFLWKRRTIMRNGNHVRQAKITDVEDYVWKGETARERAIPSAKTVANRAFDDNEIPIRLCKVGEMLMLVISPS